AGEAALYARSDEGQLWRARLHLPVNRTLLSRALSQTIKTTFSQFGIDPSSQVIHVREDRDPRVLWTVFLSGRASTLQINAGLTGRRRTREWTERLLRNRGEVLAEIPMEPLNYPQRDPGAGAVLVDMHPGEIQRVVRHDLAGVPHAVGATSFMGAMALQDPT